METIISELRGAIKGNNTKQAKLIYSKNKEQLNNYINDFSFTNTEGKKYSWYNLLYLKLFATPWVYGTKKQLKTNGFNITDEQKAYWMQRPVFDKDSWDLVFCANFFIYERNLAEKII